jgi:hypothetical protein
MGGGEGGQISGGSGARGRVEGAFKPWPCPHNFREKDKSYAKYVGPKNKIEQLTLPCIYITKGGSRF